jgi:hypothetical protein
MEHLLLRAARPIDQGRERHGTMEGKVHTRRVVAITASHVRQRPSTIALSAYMPRQP